MGSICERCRLPGRSPGSVVSSWGKVQGILTSGEPGWPSAPPLLAESILTRSPPTSRMLKYTCGCPVPIYTRSTLGSGSIKVKGFQERPAQQRETCKENTQNDPLSLPSLFPARTRKYESSFLHTDTQRDTNTDACTDTCRLTHTDTHADTQTHTNLVPELFCFKGLRSCRKKRKK